MSRLAPLVLLLAACGGGSSELPDAGDDAPVDAAPPDALPLPAGLDPAFGDRGLRFLGTDLRELAIDADGRLLVAGSRNDDQGIWSTTLCRLDDDGAPDPAWPEDGCPRTGGPYSQGLALAATPAGVVVGGTALGGTTLWRFDDTGAIDPGFDGDGHVELEDAAESPVASLIADGDDVVAMAGDAVVRVDPSGVPTDTAILTGSVLAGGKSAGGDFLASIGLRLYTLAPTFDSVTARDVDPSALVVVPLPDGGLFLAGAGWLRKELGDGSPDPGFGTDGTVTAPPQEGCPDPCELWTSVVPLPDGRIAVAGSREARRPAGSVREPMVRVYSAAGELDTSFGVDGLLLVNLFPGDDGERWVVSAAPQPGGLVIAVDDGVPGSAGFLARVLLD